MAQHIKVSGGGVIIPTFTISLPINHEVFKVPHYVYVSILGHNKYSPVHTIYIYPSNHRGVLYLTEVTEVHVGLHIGGYLTTKVASNKAL